MKNVLVIGDAHNMPQQNWRRWVALNKYLRKHRREIGKLLVIGDWLEMGSLSRFDITGSKAMEGARIAEDIESGCEAFRLLLKGVDDLPIVFTEGNHEERLKRMEEEHPKLTAITSIEERFAQATGSNPLDYLPYKDYHRLAPGVLATHVPHNARKPIESSQGARKVLALSATSVVWGHTHQLDFATLTRNGGEQLYGLNVGCFIDPLNDPPYMKGRIKDWWRGVVMVRLPEKGPWQGEFTTVSLCQLLAAA